MAEYTNSYGPYVDDYFLVFVFDEQGESYIREASFYSAGRDELQFHRLEIARDLAPTVGGPGVLHLHRGRAQVLSRSATAFLFRPGIRLLSLCGGDPSRGGGPPGVRRQLETPACNDGQDCSNQLSAETETIDSVDATSSSVLRVVELAQR